MEAADPDEDVDGFGEEEEEEQLEYEKLDSAHTRHERIAEGEFAILIYSWFGRSAPTRSATRCT